MISTISSACCVHCSPIMSTNLFRQKLLSVLQILFFCIFLPLIAVLWRSSFKVYLQAQWYARTDNDMLAQTNAHSHSLPVFGLFYEQ